MHSYIAITDFQDSGQVSRMLGVFKKYLPPHSKRKLHVGVMASYKTLHGLPTEWSKVFAPKEKIAKIFSCDQTYNCLHYASFSGEDHLSESISKAVFYGGRGIDAIQLDMTWPDPGQIAQGLDASSKPLEVILQVGTEAFKAVKNSSKELVLRLSDYETVIDRVLLDKRSAEESQWMPNGCFRLLMLSVRASQILGLSRPVV